MKRISKYRKVFESDEHSTLKDLKKTYRNLVKEWHPDKFREDDERAEEAEVKSQEIIEAYHFLVSIAPETKEQNKEAYQEILTKSGMVDYHHKGQLLEVTFSNGATYEYFGVSEKLFLQMIHSDKPMRFGKRKIFNDFLYRISKKNNEAEAKK